MGQPLLSVFLIVLSDPATVFSLVGALCLGGLIGYLATRNPSGTLALYTGMDPNTASKLVCNYGQPTNNSGVEDSTSVWFSIETLMGFINQVTANAGSQAAGGVIPTLGVRIYFARYPDQLDPAWGILDPQLNAMEYTNYSINNYAGRQTIVMVPTYQINNVNVDFDPISTVTFSNDPYTAEKAFFNAVTNNTGNVCFLNHGEMIPPPDPPAVVSNEVIKKGITTTLGTQCGTFFSDIASGCTI